MNLVAFGCSFTFGYGLPDIYDHTSTKINLLKPSIHAWPQKLGELLNCNVINKGIPAAGNLEIFNQIINYPFNENDICVILWSQFIRHDKFMFGASRRISDKLFLEKNNITNSTWQIHSRIRNWLTIHHAILFLENISVKNYSLLGILDPRFDFPKPNITNIKFKNIDDTILPHMWIIDKALDINDPKHSGGHPGIESHKNLANIFFNKLKTNVLY